MKIVNKNQPNPPEPPEKNNNSDPNHPQIPPPQDRPLQLPPNLKLQRYLRESSQQHKVIWLVAFAVALVGGWVGFQTLKTVEDPSQEAAQASVNALPVETEEVITGPIQSWVFGDGYVQAVKFKHLTFEVPGTITYVKKIGGRELREGDRVRGGELLAVVDQRTANADTNVAQAGLVESQTQVATARAGLEQAINSKAEAEANLEQAKNAKAEANANLQQARNTKAEAIANLEQAKSTLTEAQANLQVKRNDETLARKEYLRRKELYEQGVLPASELDVYENQLKNATQGITAAKSQVESAQKGIQAAETQVNSAESQIQAAETKVNSAESQIQAAETKVNSAESQIQANNSQVEAARYGVDKANAQLQKTLVSKEDTMITAPFSGILAHLNIREGDYWSPQRVQAGSDYQTIIERVPMVVIDPSQFEVVVQFPAFQGNEIQPGQRAYIVLDQDQSASATRLSSDRLKQISKAAGRVFSVSPAVSPGERAVDVTIRVNTGTANLQSGARVGVWVAVKEKAIATVVPLNALIFRDQQPHVFVVGQKEGQDIAVQREVQVGIGGLTRQEIVSGVKPGDRLVTKGKDRLVNGAPIELLRE